MAKRYPDCAIIMRGWTLNEKEEQLRQERVARNMRRFKEAEKHYQDQRMVKA
ncbi:hypothetical protein [Marinococcus halophilus]|uniref:hypothetical protein n=1 Tax=Marinococcus halophilus TaxID=1371 RepID=UPI0015C478E6|nr:hypothetical protein [Marinococcus halophilus]